MSKTVNNTHRRPMRPVTPAVKASRFAAGAAVTAGIMLTGGAAATADPAVDAPAPQADGISLPVIAPADAPSVEIPGAAVASDAASAALSIAPAADAAISISLPDAAQPAADAQNADQADSQRSSAAEQRSGERRADRSNERADRSNDNTDRSGSNADRTDDSSSDSRDRADSGSSKPSKKKSSEDKKSADSAPAPRNGGGVLSTARSGIGVPYVFGGSTRSGWDCSGFTAWVYAQHGVSLPHSAGAQAAMGTRVSRSEARPGDLVYKPGHVGIYAGGNMMVDAGNKRVDTSERKLYSGDWTFIRISR